jgi:hypothetical protein
MATADGMIERQFCNKAIYTGIGSRLTFNSALRNLLHPLHSLKTTFKTVRYAFLRKPADISHEFGIATPILECDDDDLNEKLTGVFMKTDWNLVREMMGAAIDSCEQFEACGYDETHRALTTTVGNVTVSVQDVMVSAYTYPELLRYQIIRERHDKKSNIPYVSENARIITAMAAACAELIGAAPTRPAEAQIKTMVDWYSDIAVPHVRSAITEAA